MPCKIIGGTKVPGNEKSWERKFLGTKGPAQELSFPGNESSRERKVPGTKVPGHFLPGSRQRKVSGTKVPHRDYSFLGTKGLGHEKSRYPAVFVLPWKVRCQLNNEQYRTYIPNWTSIS